MRRSLRRTFFCPEAAARDLSLGKKGKNPGNEVAGVTSYPQEHLKTITYANLKKGEGAGANRVYHGGFQQGRFMS